MNESRIFNSYQHSIHVHPKHRPYWCISRQRSWGLPIPCVYAPDDKEKRNPIVTRQLVDSVKSIIAEEGNVDWWWSSKHDKRLPSTSTAHGLVSKSTDIFDIWFDSGSSFHAVLQETADLYCEGLDQFSGWFQSSLLLSVAFGDKSPYKSLLVHGFVVDEQNRKMSKSLGNVIEPEQAIRGGTNRMPQAGLDTLRFWIAHEYYKYRISKLQARISLYRI
jgi:isoleucyl-tRNA synthetase